MLSQNEWTCSGNVMTVEEKKVSFMVRVNGELSRPGLYSVNGIIPCIIPKDMRNLVAIDRKVVIKGRMVFGKRSFVIANYVSA